MTVVGFHCSHEQINPAQLLRDVQQAEQAGFTAGMSSDHFSPWSARQGESGFAWSFLGAALASTTLPFGVVNAPGQRYHPAIIGQAIATLAQMFPGRFWAALGSGEASNERVTGDVWPRKEVRDQRLVECVTIIRRLLHGEEVSHEGLVHVNRARLWTLPEIVPDLIGPAVTPETAARLQIHLSWAPTAEEALAIAHDQWRSNVFAPPACWDVESIEALDVISENVTPAQVKQSVLVSSDFGQHTEWLREYADQGWDELYLHFVGKEQFGFIDAFGEHVLPQLSPTAPPTRAAIA